MYNSRFCPQNKSIRLLLLFLLKVIESQSCYISCPKSQNQHVKEPLFEVGHTNARACGRKDGDVHYLFLEKWLLNQ
jgi:hypothetical protein